MSFIDFFFIDLFNNLASMVFILDLVKSTTVNKLTMETNKKKELIQGMGEILGSREIQKPGTSIRRYSRV